MFGIPTIRVKSTDGYTIINEADFDPKVHQRFDDEEQASLIVGKGAKGLFFVKQNGKAVSQGFDTEDEANAELARMGSGKPELPKEQKADNA